MVFGIFIVLGPTLCELDDDFGGAVRQREQVDMNVLQDRQLLPRTEPEHLKAPTSSTEIYLPGQPFEHNLLHLPVLPRHFSCGVVDKGPDAGSGIAVSLGEERQLASHDFMDEHVVWLRPQREDTTFQVVIVKQMFVPFRCGRVALLNQRRADELIQRRSVKPIQELGPRLN